MTHAALGGTFYQIHSTYPVYPARKDNDSGSASCRNCFCLS